MIKRYLNRPSHQEVSCLRHEGEPDVIDGLAMTPAQMDKLRRSGVPISTNNLGMYFDEGVSQLDFDPPAQFRRGVDMNDLYELRRSTEKKFKKGLEHIKEEV